MTARRPQTHISESLTRPTRQNGGVPREEPVGGELGDAWWQAALNSDASEQQLLSAGSIDVASPVSRMRSLLEAWAVGFAAQRADVIGPTLLVGNRGLHPDECASFLRALDSLQLHVDSAGYVTPLAARRKATGGRYALCCKAGRGVTINTEYIIQLGGVGELVTMWEWEPHNLQVEMTEFDIVGYGADGRIVLAVEAKARVRGSDGLERLLRSVLAFAGKSPPTPTGNAARKYLQLLRLTESGPVALWLIAAGARWPFLATRGADRLMLTPIASVSRDHVYRLTEAA